MNEYDVQQNGLTGLVGRGKVFIGNFAVSAVSMMMT
jgi:hypothetical protein